MQLPLHITTMSRSVIVSYEFVDVRFLNFGELKMRFYTALHLSIVCIYWTVLEVWMLVKLLQC